MGLISTTSEMQEMPTGKELTDNVYITIIARFAMIAATALLPVFGWLLLRAVGSIDDIGHKTDSIHDQVLETLGKVNLIQNTQSIQSDRLTDHEMRMRLLERGK
jgi:hypothetical protein